MRLSNSSTPRRNRRRCGFTLAESLLAALLLALASGGMAAGVAFAARQYVRSITVSESGILCSTLRAAISAELSNGMDFRLDGDVLTGFTSQNYGRPESAGGFSDQDGVILLNGQPLIGEGAYIRGMKARLRPISYENGIFHVYLEILGRDGSVLRSSLFDARPLNPPEAGRPRI